MKFRKNIAQFNIRDAVAKVIQLQKKKASDQGIIIIPDFVNISRFQQSVELDSIFSPVMISDEARIVQVLLGLQSNALKYTEKGEIRISVEVIQQKDAE